MADLDLATHDAMLALSNLSRDAEAGGDPALMYAANRAWHQLHEHRKRSAAVPAKEPERPSRRTDWHYDSQGYCDNPGRGY